MAHLIHFHSRSKPKPEQSAPAEKNASNADMTAQTLREWRYVAYVVGIVLILLLALVEIARAGGPQYVAGIGYFNAGLAGQPVTWTNGAINYYTDMGSLSPVLNGTAADAFVADAFSRWTSISTAAVSATRSGQLAEDVSGANVVFNSDRTMTMPADIQPTAADKPVAIVYDADGLVTDALIGTGASSDVFRTVHLAALTPSPPTGTSHMPWSFLTASARKPPAACPISSTGWCGCSARYLDSAGHS